MKGWRSIIVAVGIVAGTAALKYLAGFDWVATVGPIWAMVITSSIATVMRLITTTPVGSSTPSGS